MRHPPVSGNGPRRRQEARLNELMEAVSVSMRPEAVIEALAAGLQQMVPFTRLHVALGDPDAPQLELWRAEIALDGALSVRREDPLPAPGTALRLAYEEKAPRIYAWKATRGSPHSPISAPGMALASGSILIPDDRRGQPSARCTSSPKWRAPRLRGAPDADPAHRQLSALELDNGAPDDDAQAARRRAVRASAPAGPDHPVSTRVSESLTPEEIYQIAQNELQAVLGAQYAAWYLRGDDTRLLVLARPRWAGPIRTCGSPCAIPLGRAGAAHAAPARRVGCDV